MNNWRRNDIQHNDIQHNDTQHNIEIITTLSITTVSIMYCTVMLSVILAQCQLCWVSQISPLCWVSLTERHYAERHYAERHYAECSHAECRYAVCRYAEYRFAECRGVQLTVIIHKRSRFLLIGLTSTFSVLKTFCLRRRWLETRIKSIISCFARNNISWSKKITMCFFNLKRRKKMNS
jgi:hypothetical protein